MKFQRRFRTLLALILIVSGVTGHAQVNEIKSAARGKGGGEGGSGGSGNGGGSFFFVDVFFFSLQEIPHLQRKVLHKRDSVPSVVSLEAVVHAALQPSSYYIVNPRIRGNWGIFSTDLRLNYLIEESVEGPIHLRTTDWQILQLNLVNTRQVNVRVGGGIMYEAYANKMAYSEFTAALQLYPGVKRIGGGIEYRSAEVRSEVNGQLNYDLGSSGKFHWYASLGGVFQRYYSTVNVWGLQCGLGVKIF